MQYTLTLQNPLGELYKLECSANTKLCNISDHSEWPRISTENLVFTIYGEYYPADSPVTIGELAKFNSSIVALISYGELLKVSMFGEQQRRVVLVDEDTTFRNLKETLLVASRMNADPTKYQTRFNLLKMDDEDNVLESCYPCYESAYITVSKCA